MLPQIRLQPFYSGQLGVSGSDVQRGLRWEPTGIVLFVDKNHPNATAVADGTDPEQPLTTIQTAVNNLIAFATAMSCSLEGSYIVVSSEAAIAESVTVPGTAPKGCTILGCSSGGYQPTWTPATAAGTALTLRQQNWRVSGFEFTWSGDGQGILLEWIGSNNASGAVINNNRFFGGWNGLYGINLSGAPYNVRILGNEFAEIRSAGGAGTAYAITTTTSSNAEPLECQIIGNVFWENENHVGSLNNVRSFNASLIQSNIFGSGMTIPATIMLDLRSNHGGRNIVVGNTFTGDYSNTGGYYDSTAAVSSWVGNYAEDVAEGEVADNGITVAPPAA